MKRDLIQKQYTDMHGLIHIITLSVQVNWWFPSNQGKEDIKSIKTMFSNFCNIAIYGNPVSENKTESNDV